MTQDKIDRIKKLKYRSWHCGARELDLLFGGFADQYLDSMDMETLQAYEILLDTPNPDLFTWITRAQDFPNLNANQAAQKVLLYAQEKTPILFKKF